MQRLLNDVTIEEIGQLIKSLDETDMTELIDVHLDEDTKQKLKDHLS